MKYFCTTCGYNYDEAFGDEIEGVEPGTRIESGYICPSCGEPDTLVYVEEEVHYIDDSTNDLKLLEHFIEVKLSANRELEVIIGEGEHPMDTTHRICSVSLLDEYGDLIEEKFLFDEDESITHFSDCDLENFEIRVKCNRHGVFGRKFENFYILG